MVKREFAQSPFQWSQVRVAVLGIIALLGLTYGIYQVGKVFDVFATRYVLYTPVTSVAGLREGAAVTLAGQRVGQVTAIEFIPVEARRDSNNVVMHLQISQSVHEHIRADSRVHILTQGLIGDRYVDIDPGSAGVPVLAAGDTLHAAPTVDLDRVLTLAAATLDTAQVFMNRLTRVVTPLVDGEGTAGRLLYDDALYERLVASTGQLAVTLGRMNEGEGTFGRLLRDPTLYTSLNEAVLGLNDVTGQILNEEGSLGKLVRTDSLYQSLMLTAGRADSAVGALALTLRSVSEGEGTLARLVSDPALYEAVLKAVVDLQTLIQQIRDDPSQIRPEIQVDVF